MVCRVLVRPAPLCCLIFGVLLALPTHSKAAPSPTLTQARGRDIHKIRHVIVVMQENRSFDNYFGTYPGADGIPRDAAGNFSVCVKDPRGGCVTPFHDRLDVDGGGDHGVGVISVDVDGGRMDGFVTALVSPAVCNTKPTNIRCSYHPPPKPDVMGYHTQDEIPNYWMYAQNFVLQDHLFAPAAAGSWADHLYMVSEWSARCSKAADPFSCVNSIRGNRTSPYAWTDLTYLLHLKNIPWAYYLSPGTQPDCANGARTCPPFSQNSRTPGIWNPLLFFTPVKNAKQVNNVQDLKSYFVAAKEGRLPAVSWIVPNEEESEHPPALISVGEDYVTKVINAAMSSPDWSSTAIFLSWDDWGGFYDHEPPPAVDQNGFGLRVPGLVISPYAKRGFIDHQVKSPDAVVKFIEDDFLGGQRLDPKTDGRPDPRIDVRESLPQVGDVTRDFDFAQSPRPPLLLSTHPTRPGLINFVKHHHSYPLLKRPRVRAAAIAGIVALGLLATTLVLWKRRRRLTA